MGEAAGQLDFRILPSLLLLSSHVFIALNSDVEQEYCGLKGGVVFGNRSIFWSNYQSSGRACIFSWLNTSDHS